MNLKLLWVVSSLSIVPFITANAADSSKIEFNLGTFYAQGSGQDLPFGSYGTYTSSAATGSNISWEAGNDDFNPKSNFGYQLGARYLFDNKQDIQLGWTHFNSDTTDTASHQGQTLSDGSWSTQFHTMANQIVALHDGDSINESAKNSFKYDAIDATFGQNFTLGSRFQGRIFGGVRAAQINSDITATYNGIVDNGYAFNEVDEFKSSMKGVGPQVGMTGKLNVVKCLGVTTHVAAMGLVSTSTANYSVYQNFYDGQTIVNGYNSYDGGVKVIPGYDLKMGLSCNFPVYDGSSVDLEAGYGITQYINGLSQMDSSSGGSKATAVNATINGPYFNLNYKF